MSVQNVRIKKVPVELGGKKYTFYMSMMAAASLAEKYGSVSEAEKKLNSACFKVDGDRVVSKEPGELVTKEFFDIVGSYVDAMTCHEKKRPDLFELSVEELPIILTTIFSALGFGMPEAEETADPQ
jgi:hypothetical protein